MLNAKTALTIGADTMVSGNVASSGAKGTLVFESGSAQAFAQLDALANTITVRSQATAGVLFGNVLTIAGSAADEHLGLDVSKLSQVPDATPATPGTTNVTLPANQLRQLCPGQYGSISIGSHASLSLNGGVYHVSRLVLADHANLQASEPVVILVSGGLTMGAGAIVAPSPLALDGVFANDLRIEIGTNATLDDTSELTAHLLAANGKITTGTDVHVTGAMWARTIAIGQHNFLLPQGTFSVQAPAVPPPCNDHDECTVDACVTSGAAAFCLNTPLPVDDDNACTSDRCDPTAGVSHAPLPDGTTCDGDGTCDAGACELSRAVFSQDFEQAVAAPAQCAAWTDFRANQLTRASYNTVTVSGTFAPLGTTCADPGAATEICRALHDGSFASVLCEGHSWTVTNCNGPSPELDVDTSSVCGCDFSGFGSTVRPCNAGIWGGVHSSTCFGPSQRMTVSCQ